MMDWMSKVEEFKEMASANQTGKRRGLTPWIIVLVLFFVSAFLLRASLSARERQKDLEERMAYQEELLVSMRAQLEEDSANKKESVPVITSETIKQQLNALQTLVTQEYIYTNADKSEHYAKWFFDWKRPFSGASILVTYDGSIKAGIDLNEIDVDVNEESRKITVTLPGSRITDNTIPQETIDVVEVKNGLFNPITLDDYNQFISDQKVIMEQKAIDYGVLSKADEQARAAVTAFLTLMPGIEGENAYTLEVK